jgi:hypothetical protein
VSNFLVFVADNKKGFIIINPLQDGINNFSGDVNYNQRIKRYFPVLKSLNPPK